MALLGREEHSFPQQLTLSASFYLGAFRKRSLISPMLVRRVALLKAFDARDDTEVSTT